MVHVQKWGIDAQNAEDIAQTILTTFFEKDALSDFNPEYESEYKGVRRKAQFRTFLTGFVGVYVRHYRDRQGLQRTREGMSTDTPVRLSDEDESTWIEEFGPEVVEEYEDLHFVDFVLSVRGRLTGDEQLVNLFNAIVRQVHNDGALNTTELAEEFGCSRTAIRNRIQKLRDLISAQLA